MGLFGSRKTRTVTADQALPGRQTPVQVPARHEVLGGSLAPPYPQGTQIAEFALGCFWGAERKYWQTPGVVTTAVGYEGGYTPNPAYEEVCSGRTGHAEAVRVVFDPQKVSYADLLKIFWESHNPTQGCGKATTSAPSTARRSSTSRRSSKRPPWRPATPTRRG
jgi:peptide-methionine (S)-S-oxide reductase